MDLSYGAEAEAFRKEVRAFLTEAWQPGDRRKGELRSFIRAFRAQAVAQGYLYRSVPKRYGGSEQPVDVIRAQVIREEFARARAPMEMGGNGINMTVPTLLEVGTEEQRELFIAKTLEGAYIWGQGYSEPGAGSDLAALQMSAVEDGNDLICNGQKIWNTHADVANWGFFLVRTGKYDRPQKGITFLLVDMSTPGVTVRPIISP